MQTDRESIIARQVERLRRDSYRTIERQVAEKRVAWFRQNGPDPNTSHPATPRQAYELLFLRYMGLAQEDVPITSETESRIVWRSLNECPTWQACARLGLDTRQVCRAIYEKSTQALISQLDPELRFHRSYQIIRPHADHCQEMIVRVEFRKMMALALQEALTSKSEGNKGYGAVVVFEDRIVGQAHDTAVTERDPSLHAEVNAIRQAVHSMGDPNLSGAILFATCEPCPMCTALAVWANMTTIVYGASIEETERLGRSRIHVSTKEIIAKSPAMVEVIGGVLGDECLALYA